MPLPVLFACVGCAEHGNAAADVAAVLVARGFAERASHAPDAFAGCPLYVIEGCAKRCAGAWLRGLGVRAQRQFILAAPGESAERIAERIMEGWPSRLA